MNVILLFRGTKEMSNEVNLEKRLQDEFDPSQNFNDLRFAPPSV